MNNYSDLEYNQYVFPLLSEKKIRQVITQFFVSIRGKMMLSFKFFSALYLHLEMQNIMSKSWQNAHKSNWLEYTTSKTLAPLIFFFFTELVSNQK